MNTSQNRRQFLRTCGTALALSVFPGMMTGCKNASKKPNIILILMDDLGWKDAGFMGSDYYETPHLDQLAAEGAVFTDAYANAPNCAPSRACLLSGFYPPRHGIYTVSSAERGKSRDRKIIPTKNKTTLDRSFVTIGEELKAAGYVTASIGKWHMGDDPESGPTAQGFEVNIGGNHKGHPPAGYFAPYALPNLEDAPQGEYLTDRLTDEAIQFIDKNQDQQFFLYLPHYAVHTPIQAREEKIEKYKDKISTMGQANPDYAAMIESSDEGIGQIAQRLEELGIDENTIIVFTSDNGGVKGITSMEPLRGGKGMLYEGGIRVPFFVRWPGQIKKGISRDEPIIGLDLYPTLLELAGINKPLTDNFDGKSILPLLTGASNLEREALFWHFPAYLEAGRSGEGARDPIFRTRPGAAVRKGAWKLIEYFEDGFLELYNLDSDISEQNNLAGALPDKREELLQVMRGWRKEVNAPVPNIPNPDYESF